MILFDLYFLYNFIILIKDYPPPNIFEQFFEKYFHTY